ncbi:MAG: MOSC domain-containing protein [Candidatus Eremiobacter antarcticus]|nr:MOSC domain-containing protein [Candidatus Eremiobacteraeota bacterium]MBC5807478.1 MOSC domain-containing protein [Candidatus Eremiobacteraeota bacterium]
MGLVVSVNVGVPKETLWQGRTVRSAIWKYPVDGSVAIRGVNADGDDQADRKVHGGVDKSLYAYGAEDYEWWSSRLGRTLPPGQFGDNLTVRGIDVSAALIGERWTAGSATLEVTEPRIPCYKLAMRMQDPKFPRAFTAALRPGAYMRIVAEGSARSGDAVSVAHRPSHGLSIRKMFDIYSFHRERLGEFLEVAELSDGWKEWAAKNVRPLQIDHS